MSRKIQTSDPQHIRDQLTGFEHDHNMGTEKFLREWKAGRLGDRPEYFDWYGVCFLAIRMGILTPQGQVHAIG